MRANTSHPAIGTLCTALLLLCRAAAASAAPDLPQPALRLVATRLPAAKHLPANPVQSIFHIEKSENRNQVHYGARVDQACRPLGAKPVYAYWRMLERGHAATEALLNHEEQGYGIRSPQLVSRQSQGGRVQLQLRAFPNRMLTIELFPHGEHCAGRALTQVRREPAVLQSIYLDIGFLFSLNHALVRGTRLADGRAVHERLER